MFAALVAALPYTLTVFAAGAVLGTLRVLWLAPRLGEGGAILLEVPVMLAVSFLVARAVVRWRRVPARLGPRLLMGVAAFALLQGAEAALAIGAFGRTLAEHLATIAAPARLPGLAAQAVFAAMPALLLLAPARR